MRRAHIVEAIKIVFVTDAMLPSQHMREMSPFVWKAIWENCGSEAGRFKSGFKGKFIQLRERL